MDDNLDDFDEWYEDFMDFVLPDLPKEKENLLPHSFEWYRKMERRMEQEAEDACDPDFVQLKCVVCGRTIWRDPAEIRYYSTCSHRCNAVYRNKHFGKTEGTDIERIMEVWLIGKGFVFEKQRGFLIRPFATVVDFLVEPNIIIYCDGDYWHRGFMKRRKDQLQKKALEAMGYRVYRISGSRLKDGSFVEELDFWTE